MRKDRRGRAEDGVAAGVVPVVVGVEEEGGLALPEAGQDGAQGLARLANLASIMSRPSSPAETPMLPPRPLIMWMPPVTGVTVSSWADREPAASRASTA